MMPPAAPLPDPNAPPAQPEPRKVLPLDDDARAKWLADIDAARAVRKTVSTWWDANIEAYAPAMDEDPNAYGSEIHTNRDFTLVERKKVDLCYQRPDLIAVASPLMEGQEAKLDTHTQILNEQLGPDGIDSEALIDRVLFDVVCVSGMGWSVMGYDSATVPTPVTRQIPGGAMPGAVLGLQDVPQTVTETVQVPIYEECFWNWLSPWCGLVPAGERTTIADKWKWIGYDFEMPVRTAKRKGWVPDDYKGGPASPDLHYDHGLNPALGDEVARGVVIFYKSSLYRDDQPHPLHQTLLILIDDVDEPAEHKDSPYQTLTPQGGLTPDSLIGYPVHPCTIRVLTDSPYIPSDCTLSRPTVNELDKSRQQMVERHDSQLLAYYYNVDTLPVDALQKAIAARIGSFVGVPGDAFTGEGAIKEFPHGQWPRENFEFNSIYDNDLARMHAIDASQSGADSGGSPDSATGEQIKQSNVNARMGRERARVISWYVRGATKYSQIMQRLLPVTDAAKIVGQQKAQEWDTWRKQVPATLAFTAVPDSSLRTDMVTDRKRVRDDYTFFAQDPYVNRPELLKHMLPKLGYPQSVLQTQPPEKGPEPMKFAISIASADLNPMLPTYANVYQILTQQGVKDLIAPMPEAQLNQPPVADDQHGGKVAQMENLSKHASDMTGNLQGSGAPTPMGPGGQQA